MSITRIISIANSKGGVGKSSVTMFLAVALAMDKNKRVLILDTDSQRTIGDYYEGEVEDDNGAVTVEAIAPQRVHNFIARWGSDYDFIFIDIPRLTAKAAEKNILSVLNCCDSVLIPVTGSQIDLLSTLDFITIMEGVKNDRKADGLKFKYYGFLNRRNRRKEHEETANYLKDSNLKMFDSSLKDLKIFSNPSLVESILNSKEGEKRFLPFYNEFLKAFKIK